MRIALAGAALLAAWTGQADARVTRVRVDRTEPFLAGAAFGDTGAYEHVTGVIAGELDPADRRNAVVVGLDRAPRNAAGLVEYETDFDILRPADPRRGNHHLLFEVTNRGNKPGLALLNQVVTPPGSPSLNAPKSVAETGDALVFRLGYTMAWTGWDPDLTHTNASLSIREPVLAGVTQEVRDELVSGTRGPPVERFHLSYAAAAPYAGSLTMRQKAADAPVPLTSGQWRFVDARTVELLPPGTRPAPGVLYDLTYTATDPWVSGIGFAATRDVVSFLRANQEMDPARGIAATLGFGVSQSGRFLREFVADGFNADERGARVFDGVLTYTAGAGKVFLNALFAQPGTTRTQHEDQAMPEEWFPFSAAAAADPVTGTTASLLPGAPTDPRLIEVNTSAEYWQKGASLLTTDPAGGRDLALPANARAFLVAGTQHTGRAGAVDARGPCINLRNPHNPAPALRALLADLDAWVGEAATPPPASRVPTVADRTLLAPEALNVPAIVDLVRVFANDPVIPHNDPASLDWVHPAPVGETPYRALVPALDGDGNERAGIILPDLAAAFGTFTGWNLYARPYPVGEMCDRDGSWSPFARDADARLVDGDPRPSVAERYPSREALVALVTRAAAALVADRLLLVEDAARYIAWAKDAPL